MFKIISIIIFAFILRSIIFAFFLWLAMKITKEDSAFLSLLMASIISSLTMLIPEVGFFLSPLVLIWLVSRWSTATFWPNATLIVVVAWGFSIFVQVSYMMLVK